MPKIISKWIRDLNKKSIQVLEENMGQFLYNLGVRKGFQSIIQNPDAIINKVLLHG